MYVAAVLIEHDTDAAVRAAKRVHDAFATPFQVDSHPLTVTPSIGLATAPADALDISAERILKQADLAMYQAKRSSNGAVSLFPITRIAPSGPDQLAPHPS